MVRVMGVVVTHKRVPIRTLECQRFSLTAFFCFAAVKTASVSTNVRNLKFLHSLDFMILFDSSPKISKNLPVKSFKDKCFTYFFLPNQALGWFQCSICFSNFKFLKNVKKPINSKTNGWIALKIKLTLTKCHRHRLRIKAVKIQSLVSKIFKVLVPHPFMKWEKAAIFYPL